MSQINSVVSALAWGIHIFLPSSIEHLQMKGKGDTNTSNGLLIVMGSNTLSGKRL